MRQSPTRWFGIDELNSRRNALFLFTYTFDQMRWIIDFDQRARGGGVVAEEVVQKHADEAFFLKF